MEFLQYFISEELIYAIGWTVMHSLWQAFVIAIVMALVLQLLQKKSARVRYEVSTFALFMVLVSAISTFIWYFDAIDQGIATTWTLTGQTSLVDQVTTVTLLQGFTQSCIDYFNEHLPMIVLIWILGAGFFMLRLLGGLVYVQRLKYHRNLELPSVWQDKVKRIQSKIPVKRSVKIFESASIKVPMVIGYLKPFILLPIGTINQLDAKEVEAIIAHELAHVFRNDFLMNIFISFAEVLFYFNPAVWWISGNIRLERENSCDDLAIKACGNSLTYAKALVRLQELNAYAPSFAMPFSGQKNQLLNRIKRILNQPQTRTNIMEKLTATCFLLIAIIFMSVSANNNANQVNALSSEDVQETETEVIDLLHEQNAGLITGLFAGRDTTPEQKRMLEAESVEITRKDGEITELIIDGETIPAEEYEKYDAIIADKVTLEGEVPVPPTPPTPPVPPTGINAPNPPMPPSSPAPPVAPMIWKSKSQKQTIRKETNEDGQTMIIIEEAGGDPVEIIVDDSEGVIIVDGDKIEEGETAIIREESTEYPGGIHFFNKSDFKIYADSIHWPNANFDKKRYDEYLAQVEKNKADVWFFEFDEAARARQKERAEIIKRKMEQNQLKSRAMEEEFKVLKERANRQKELELKSKEQSDHLRKLYKEYEIVAKERRLKERADRMRRIEEARVLRDEARWRDLVVTGTRSWSRNNMSKQIAESLLADGLIDDSQNFSFSLNNKRLKVNGKKQSDAIKKKYLALYEKLSGKELNKKANVNINMSVN